MTWSHILNIVLGVVTAVLLQQYLTQRNKLLDVIQMGSYSYSKNKTFSFQSSVHCHGDTMHNKICHFHNLCYYPTQKQFVFFRGDNSVMGSEGLFRSEGHFLALTSVYDVDGMTISLMELPWNASLKFGIEWVEETSFVLSRFKPDNVMHVIHDDILPLYHTLNILYHHSNQKMEPFNLRLVFMDDFGEHEHDVLYKALSKYPMIYKSNLSGADEKGMKCFLHLHAGLSRKTTWYQYGFKSPQGPIQKSTVTGDIIKSASEYLMNNLQCKSQNLLLGMDYLVLFSRKSNRLILNEKELMLEIMRKTRLKIMSVSSEDYSVCELILIVRNSKGLIGMHGSSLIYSVFLKPKSIVIELFPYAVNPMNYTPFKTLANISGINLVYKSWRNMVKEKSRGFPNREKIIGGISHLSSEQQRKIIDQSEIPLHLCCDDASWLYHIYQDTEVDVEKVASSCKLALTEADYIKIKSHEQLISPGYVSDLQCVMSQCMDHKIHLTLTWKSPWTSEYLKFKSYHYYVLLQAVPDGISVAYAVKAQTYTVKEGLECGTSYNVWVRLVLDEERFGPFQYVFCET